MKNAIYRWVMVLLTAALLLAGLAQMANDKQNCDSPAAHHQNEAATPQN